MSESQETPAGGRADGEGFMPGDPAPRRMIEKILRVDHAGEFGAVRIYQGQRAVLGRSASCGDALRRMEEEERRHLQTFETLVSQRRVRPTLLQPLWHVMGFALGAGTALMGEKAAMACTVAVEEVIEGHYAGQLEQLGEDETDLKQTVAEFREDELHHRDVGLAGGAEQTPAYPVLSAAIRSGTRLAIWLSERI
ncbi:demethoxyubiquinone hydroxylase family protein [Telmatospirillum siberiense]|uniref:3-demethoxyubiquinol 3-hydroxylase n=1 Tax=Telmatospirillum siberiense TaxID=382514 RepID=A0A2N3PQX3_9PROT|nr:demethoxyubiquinone hydroxylase family protein [Telmatospirillum siberiense]PKU22782.1 demethoxyubiquinone hydroxylase family protein [Telmatospirillum siberiense]